MSEYQPLTAPQNIKYDQEQVSQPVYYHPNNYPVQRFPFSQQQVYQQAHVVITTEPEVNYAQRHIEEYNSKMYFVIGFFFGLVWIVNFIRVSISQQ